MMSNTTSDPSNFFEHVFATASSFLKHLFGTAETEGLVIEHSIAKYGNAVVNELKTLQSNPQVELLAGWFVKIAEGIDPALTPLISGLELEFPKILNVATGVLGEVEKPVKEQMADGLAALGKTKLANSTLGSNVLGGINAAVQAYIITNNPESVKPATDAQLITSAQLVHANAL